MEGKWRKREARGGKEEMYVASKEGKEVDSFLKQLHRDKKRVSLCLCATEREKEWVLTGHWRGEECPALAQENRMEGGVCSHCCCQPSTFPPQSHGDFLTYRLWSCSLQEEFFSHKHIGSDSVNAAEQRPRKSSAEAENRLNNVFLSFLFRSHSAEIYRALGEKRFPARQE